MSYAELIIRHLQCVLVGKGVVLEEKEESSGGEEMTEQDTQKLAEFGGLKVAQIWGWYDVCGDFIPELNPGEKESCDTDQVLCYDDDGFWVPVPDFPHDLSLCFKWLVQDNWIILFWKGGNQYRASVQRDTDDPEHEFRGSDDKEWASALCQAILKMLEEQDVKPSTSS